ncbi:MAG: hypothetical protein ACQEUT_07250 [Bacillota bacterium]
MNKLAIKLCVVFILCGILICMIVYEKKDEKEFEEKKVTLVEKYFSPSQTTVAEGVKTKKQITLRDRKGKKCAMEFSNKKIFEVDCDKYLDFTIGDKVIITYRDEQLIRLGKK